MVREAGVWLQSMCSARGGEEGSFSAFSTGRQVNGSATSATGSSADGCKSLPLVYPIHSAYETDSAPTAQLPQEGSDGKHSTPPPPPHCLQLKKRTIPLGALDYICISKTIQSVNASVFIWKLTIKQLKSVSVVSGSVTVIQPFPITPRK